MASKGYIHVYTGDGKGKTTAALGLALRSAGHGMGVFIGQFMKGIRYGELNALELIPSIEVAQFGDEVCIRKEEVTDLHRAHAREGLAVIKEVMRRGDHPVVIMDEICVTLWFEILSLEEVMALVKAKPAGIELILTGRKAPQELIEIADLVTEMKEIKHYYTQGVLARDGVER
ncbi:cob(I)yrinic acid a,c-diamide adenosyltransferase [Desulfocicer vacuolatum DSM 3385]|uniref:corrinoid adenosyltransferase n=1 Tax=Desulfocicer vacuolatum DSM 3385 TaxID=1121400 RepID=A0A1W1ZW07_9BACT|nr:cob(I)yrinic acid a,c-diamide adenosyltransferase [Desulfocicer vacuolatum]SMC52639.1 cob(I)yrinic acid a,c-diamide adenosyltransferase [Desulfocicer vacuolatum DSM 3385]